MSNYLNSHFNHYAVFSPHLASARVVNVEHPAFNRKFQGLQVLAMGLLVGAIVGMGAYLFQLRSSALTQTQEAPVVSQTAAPKPTETSAPAAVPAPEPPKPAPVTLQSIVDKWNSETKGTYGVSIIELNGAGRSASLNASTQFRGASIYKLYLAHYLYNQASQGKLSLEGHIGGMTKTVNECIRAMIVNSDNYCAESLGAAVGWNALQNSIRASGFSGTSVSSPTITTASDTANLLIRLNNGSLIANTQHSQQLLDYMKIQIYRSGIPAGVPGVTVANKVGFNPGVWNDAAIVYGQKSTYVMVVLGNSGSAAIKDLSARVAEFLNK
jgi:beta-lactamase class A